ncbi:hypothetical protein [Ktedonobacter sp. SOSP1-85]|uniref:hypothetical protein n=1 Tax=Ktedonobacter sp. SOSP1-85 TaxID=2778367 RepID=UPI0019167ED1|nr:hypothetical protein [Ktedonobacter sp. SOSP1-85]
MHRNEQRTIWLIDQVLQIHPADRRSPSAGDRQEGLVASTTGCAEHRKHQWERAQEE